MLLKLSFALSIFSDDMRDSNQVPTLYNSSATSPLTKAVVVAMAGMILPAISLLYGKNNNNGNQIK